MLGASKLPDTKKPRGVACRGFRSGEKTPGRRLPGFPFRRRGRLFAIRSQTTASRC